MMYMFRDRRVMSIAFTQGRTTSEFGRPFGFSGAASILRAVSASMSNGPTLVVPMKQRFAFSSSCNAEAAFEPVVRSGLMNGTGRPSKRHSRISGSRYDEPDDGVG